MYVVKVPNIDMYLNLKKEIENSNHFKKFKYRKNKLINIFYLNPIRMLQEPPLRDGHRDGDCNDNDNDNGDDDGKVWQQEQQRLWQYQVNNCEKMAMMLAMTVAMPWNLFLKNRAYFWKIGFIFEKKKKSCLFLENRAYF